MDGIKQKLIDEFGEKYNLHIEYLETERYPKGNDPKERFDLYNQKYLDVHLDLLICVSIDIYRERKDLIELEVGLLFSEQDISDSLIITKKNEIGINYSHFFQGRWWGGLGTKWQQNTELDLDYRVQLGLGAGYDIIRKNPVRFYVLGGLLVNREKPTDSVSFSTNFEGQLSLKFTWLQFRHPKINISTNFDAYPSITIRNRYRLEYNLSAKYEIFKDFFLGLTYYDDYDSKPTGGGPALNDWSVIFSIGYSF